LYTGLELDSSYEIKVRRYDGNTIPTYRYSPSAGASQIIATSLIAGLSKYTTREAPIVIDTPLGRLDHIHRKNLVKLYPSLNRQVIILYQTSELDKDDLDLLQDSIASEWVLEEEPDNPDLSRIRLERNYL
jgi:DNA sulfur modification protein DndD